MGTGPQCPSSPPPLAEVRPGVFPAIWLWPGTGTWGNGGPRTNYRHGVRGRTGHIVPDARPGRQCDTARYCVALAFVLGTKRQRALVGTRRRGRARYRRLPGAGAWEDQQPTIWDRPWAAAADLRGWW